MSTSHSAMLAGLVSGVCAAGSLYEVPNTSFRYVKRDELRSDRDRLKADIDKIAQDFSSAKRRLDAELNLKNV